MDRKIKRVDQHLDKPPRQRWLYKLSDMSFPKVIVIIWIVCLIAIGVAILTVKGILAFLNK